MALICLNTRARPGCPSLGKTQAIKKPGTQDNPDFPLKDIDPALLTSGNWR